MTRLLWDQTGSREYETGVDHGVLYPMNAVGAYPAGVPWNGLAAVTESPSGAEPSPVYADNIKYLNLVSAEEFGCTIEAYTYPEEFAECDGSKQAALTGAFLGQQPRKQFGLVYRTLKGNDVLGQEYGYKLHLIYGALASPSEKGYQTVNDTPEAISFSWEVSTTPVAVTGFKPTAYLVVDSNAANPAGLALLEDELFGDATVGVANLPLPDAVIALLTVGG